MLQLALFDQDETTERAGHALAENFSSAPVKRSVQEDRQRLNSASDAPAVLSNNREVITLARFSGASPRLISVAQWRCPHCRAIHHYWPAKSDCQRCRAVVEFVPANQAAQTISEWVIK